MINLFFMLLYYAGPKGSEKGDALALFPVANFFVSFFVLCVFFFFHFFFSNPIKMTVKSYLYVYPFH